MNDKIDLTFHGAAGAVTGSKSLLQVGDTRILVDAGMFQGLKRLRRLNWRPLEFEPSAVDHVLLTHTHIDHVGFLPRLVAQGLTAPVHCTAAAGALTPLMLRDAAKIQEEDAAYANRKGFSKHEPALPLYTVKDAEAAIELVAPVRYNQWVPLGRDGALRARFHNCGHILGSSFIEVRVPLEGSGKGHRSATIIFSGDVGRIDAALHPDPKPLPRCDVLVIESTYGDRLHQEVPLEDQVGDELRETLGRGGTVLFPAFAVGRSQQITWILRRLMIAGKLPQVPIHIDSPMAVNATRIYSRFMNRRNLDEEVLEDGRLRLFPHDVSFHSSGKDSRKLNDLPGPRIIVSSSGMLSGGRVLHHLRRLAPDRNNLILLVGYQAEGTRGRALLDGAENLKMHGKYIPIRARFAAVHGLSGHADKDGLLDWVASAPSPPPTIIVNHGEPRSSAAFAKHLEERFGVTTRVPELGEGYDLRPFLERVR